MKSAKEVGFNAYKQGRPRSSNPFQRGTPAFLNWIIGWRLSQTRHFDELKKEQK